MKKKIGKEIISVNNVVKKFGDFEALKGITAKIFELLPKPLITQDQLRLLKYNNIASGKYKTNSDIGIPSVKYFDEEVKKYCYMWREGGQFSTDKYKSDTKLNN